MGAVYAREVLERPSPRVALLNIGSEAGKGNRLYRETYERLASSGLPFAGNVEARELFAGKADVVVCDGFTGNVALKAMEGAGEACWKLLKAEVARRPSPGSPPCCCAPSSWACGGGWITASTARRSSWALTAWCSSVMARRTPGPWPTASGWR